MKIYLNLDAEGYVLSVSKMNTGGPMVEILEGLDLAGVRLGAYRWDGARLVLDEARLETLTAAQEALAAALAAAQAAEAQLARAQEAALALSRELAQSYELTDDQRLAVVALYPEWSAGMAYGADTYLTYGMNSVGDAQLYKVVSAHTSQADWTPDATPALYTAIGLTDAGYPVWARPTGAHDAYNTGDVVDYSGTLYESTMDGNIYSPDEYPDGWTQVEV